MLQLFADDSNWLWSYVQVIQPTWASDVTPVSGMKGYGYVCHYVALCVEEPIPRYTTHSFSHNTVSRCHTQEGALATHLLRTAKEKGSITERALDKWLGAFLFREARWAEAGHFLAPRLCFLCCFGGHNWH